MLVFQLLIGCELLAALFSKAENQRYEFLDFMIVTDGHHLAYPNGYIVHLFRDFFIMLFALLIIQLGRQQFVYRRKTRTAKVEMVACPAVTKRPMLMPIAGSAVSTS